MNYLDSEEKKIIESYEMDEWIPTEDNSLKEAIIKSAKNSLVKIRGTHVNNRTKD